MVYANIRNARLILEDILSREDIPIDVREALFSAKKELHAAEDQLVWIRSRSREIIYAITEMAEALNLEVKIGLPILKTITKELVETLRKSEYVEATLENDGKIKIEKIVAVDGKH